MLTLFCNQYYHEQDFRFVSENEFDYIIIDECHHANGGNVQEKSFPILSRSSFSINCNTRTYG